MMWFVQHYDSSTGGWSERLLVKAETEADAIAKAKRILAVSSPRWRAAKRVTTTRV